MRALSVEPSISKMVLMQVRGDSTKG
jgi:hypothetical protein